MCMPSLRCMLNPRLNRRCTLNRRRALTGIIVRIRMVITHTSKVVRVGGREWFRPRLRRERRAGNMNWQRGLLLFFVVAVMGGCATMPTGPTVSVMPGPGKPFEVFMADDAVCRQWAQQQIGGVSPSQTANQNLAAGAIVGTALGAGLGAAMGSVSGNAGAGAAIGAGAGLLTGTAIASNPAYGSEWQLQRRYDIAYQQCMYAKGNQVPGIARQQVPAYAPPPPPGSGSGSFVTVPGQYVNGKWVPEHRVLLPTGPGEQAAPPGPSVPQGPNAPPPR
jgi:hypothetical protein